ncbi:MAG: hypothetical protein OSA99_15080 [Acidimicrobiales bacterium]|nr:hypothetical protein [Acidimicrobiales bacterium]MDE0804630.1 hypothetical protein [Acidimicrobiales bacterium]|tara:strand:+ start:2911 stop:3207 length:297 start_codon:yes stop_codon:yes gene_type:complete
MSHNGTWNISVTGPQGSREATLDLRTDENGLAGSVTGEQGEQTFEGGTIDGDDLAWTIDVTTPMALTLEFAVTVGGDTMNGTVNLGGMGQGTLSGTRA